MHLTPHKLVMNCKIRSACGQEGSLAPAGPWNSIKLDCKISESNCRRYSSHYSSHLRAPQSKSIHDHRHGTKAHRGGGNHRAEK